MLKTRSIRIVLWIFILGMVGYLAYAYFSFSGNPITKYTEGKKLQEEMESFYKKDFQIEKRNYDFKNRTYSITLKDDAGVKTNAWHEDKKLHTDYMVMMWAKELKGQYDATVKELFPTYTFDMIPTFDGALGTMKPQKLTSYYENHQGYGLLFDIKTKDTTYETMKATRQQENERIFKLIKKIKETKSTDVGLFIRYKDNNKKNAVDGYLYLEYTQLIKINAPADLEKQWTEF
ncbi:MAG: hypothetical protein ACI35O_11320 [Bacillaceae bacterium]